VSLSRDEPRDEAGERWGHGGELPRIVRVGTHREGNFRSRMADHYVIDERKMEFNRNQPAPKDRISLMFLQNSIRVLLGYVSSRL
jgi:hypothetical protein